MGHLYVGPPLTPLKVMKTKSKRLTVERSHKKCQLSVMSYPECDPVRQKRHYL